MPAKYIYQPPPDFRLDKNPSLAAQRYYEAQKQIWAEGYFRDGVKILSGKHYFYMQEITLKTGKGEFIRPYWKDSDDLVFTTIDDCIEKGDDLLVLKRREIGLTSMMCGLAFWYARTMPGTTLNITSADTKRFSKMFNDKFYIAFSKMSPYIMNCQPKNMNRTKNDVYLKVDMKRKTASGDYEDVETEFNFVETSQSEDSVANFSSSRTPLMLVDEIFLHKRVQKLLRSALATMMSGAEKFGFFLGGGTCEDTVTQDDLKQFHKLWVEAQDRGIRTLFLPAWLGLQQFSTNGWSNEKAATEWVMRELEKKEKLSDQGDAIAWKKNYPLTTDWIWDLAAGDGAFEQDVMDMIALRQSQLIEQKVPEPQVKLLPTANGIESFPDPKPRGKHDGGFWMVEPPEPNQQYYQTIDGAASGKEDGAVEGSWICSIIFKGQSLKGDTFSPVCIYFERPNRLEDGYRHMVNQFNYYNKYQGMIHVNYESNAGTGGNFGTYLDKEGLFKYIMRRKDLTSKGWVDTKKLGTAVNEDILIDLARRANPFLRKHIMACRSSLFLSGLAVPKGDNSDIRSAFLIFMASVADWDKPKKEKPRPTHIESVQLVRGPRGEMNYVTVKIPVANDNVPVAEVGKLQQFQRELEMKYGSAYWYQRSTQEERQKYNMLKGF